METILLKLKGSWEELQILCTFSWLLYYLKIINELHLKVKNSFQY